MSESTIYIYEQAIVEKNHTTAGALIAQYTARTDAECIEWAFANYGSSKYLASMFPPSLKMRFSLEKKEIRGWRVTDNYAPRYEDAVIY